MKTSHAVRTLVLCAGAALGVSARSQAQTLSWNNAAGGNAASSANWTPNQVPGAPNDLVFNLNSTYPVTWNSSVIASLSHTLRRGVVTYSLSSPHTIGAGGLRVGDQNGDDATLTLTTGTLNVNAPIIVADDAGSAGVLNVNDDDADLIMTLPSADMFVASNAPGALNITGGGLVRVADQFIAGNNAAGTSTVTISGATNTLPLARSTLSVLGTSQSRFGQGGDATVSIASGGLADFAGDLAISLGSASNSSATVAGLGGIVPQNSTLRVDGDLLIGRNTTVGSAAGVGSLNVNADGRVVVGGGGGTLFLAGDPDGGTGSLHVAAGGEVTTHSLDIANGFVLDLDGGSVDIDGGVFTWSATSSGAVFNGSPGTPVITMINNATATLSPVGLSPPLRVGAGAGANRANFDVRTGSDLTIASGRAVLGDGSDDFGSMIVNGVGSTMTLSLVNGSLTVGLAGSGRFEAEAGGAVSGRRLEIAADPTSTGDVLVEGDDARADFSEIFVGGDVGGAGGVGNLSVNAHGLVTVATSIVVFPDGKIDVSPNGLLHAPTVNPVVHGLLELERDGVMNAELTFITDGGVLRGPNDVPGLGTLNSRVQILVGGTLELVNGDLEVGDGTSDDGFIAADGSLVAVGAHTLTLHDANRAVVDDVTINGGHIIAPNGLEIVTPGTNGTMDGTGTITTSELFIESGGSVITATGPDGITINGKFRNNSGLIDGTKYTFNDNPAADHSGWTGAGTIDAQVVFNSGTEVNALANMTMGDGSNFGVTFNVGSEMHADTRRITLLDGNGVGLPSVTDFSGGHIVCAQPLVLGHGRRLSGRGGSVDTPLLTIFGRLSPAELVGEPVGETGEMTINGNLTLAASADFDVEIGGRLIPIEFDRVIVDGNVVLNGAINLSLVNGFNPPPGSRFIIMTYDSVSGAFAQQNLPPGWQIIARPRVMEAVNGCPADFNNDGFVNSQDFFDYTVAFFNADQEQGGPADFNLDGFINSQDFFDFLIAFFNGC